MDLGANMDMDMDMVTVTDAIFISVWTDTNRNLICFGSVLVFFTELKNFQFVSKRNEKIGVSKQTKTED
jgi:hypothetical protein